MYPDTHLKEAQELTDLEAKGNKNRYNVIAVSYYMFRVNQLFQQINLKK